MNSYSMALSGVQDRGPNKAAWSWSLRSPVVAFFALVATLWISVHALGQDTADPSQDAGQHGFESNGGFSVGTDGFGANDLFPNLSLNGFGQAEEEPVELSASYQLVGKGARPGEATGRLHVTARLAPTWHIYSVTQKPGGPTPTRISILEPKTIRLAGAFQPDQPPKRSVSELYDGLTVEEHEGTVRWTAPIDLPATFNGDIKVDFFGLVCKSGGDNRCMPVQQQLVAKLAGGRASETLVADKDGAQEKSPIKIRSESSAVPFRDGDYVVQWTGVVSPSTLAPGQSGVLQFTALPDPGYHVYQAVVDDSESSTNFVVTDKDGLLVGKPVASKSIVTKTILPSLPPIKYYEGKVTWQLPIKVPENAKPGPKTIEGMIGYQACTDSSCQRPTALKFVAKVTVGKPGDVTPDSSASSSSTSSNPITMVSAKSRDALDAAASTKWVDAIELADQRSGDPDLASQPQTPTVTAAGGSDGSGQSGDLGQGAASDAEAIAASATADAPPLPLLLLLAFLGGLILNVMPCVLPVVGLKIMGFVSQAGEDRGRILVLNLVYAAGILAVFAILAVVAAVSKFGWGEQFTYFPVKFGLTVVLFALALSYLGVWEIPVPGMAAGKMSQELQNREGLMGAFSKGIFATILATPCSGPLLGYILGLTLNLSPAYTIAIFLTVGLGMASPYLLIGFQPRLVTWLPKPGAWMETLKQLMAFLFLGTVAFFFAQFSDEQKVPVFVSLIGVWFGCWIIGQVPDWAEFQKRLMAWAGGIASAAIISIAAFTYLKHDDQLNWQDYNETKLVQLQQEGRTVMLDFGAKWCLTCKMNYEVALNTPETREVLDELDAIAMYADWTDYNEEIKQKLAELNSRSIPLLVIYPGNDPDNPIILRDIVTQNDVIEALRKAGASAKSQTARLRRSDQTMAVTRH